MITEADQVYIAREREKVTSLPQPNVGVMLTYLCGGRCVGCLAGMDRPDRIINKTFMSDDIVDQIINQLNEVPGSYRAKLNITGGEPTLHPDFVSICQKFADANFDVRIVTNANFIKLNTPIEEQPKLIGMLDLIRRPNVSVKLPLDDMHANSFPRLPKIMELLNTYLKEKGFKYGEDFVYSIITNSLEGVAHAAIRYGYVINEENAIGIIRDWRPYYNIDQLSNVVNFLQISPDGHVFQNYNQMLTHNPLGSVKDLGKFIGLMSQKIAQGNSRLFRHEHMDVDWAKQAGDLVNIYNNMIRDTNSHARN